nr:MAG TPA: hypothetical protein [Caudoviricetes sp.]
MSEVDFCSFFNRRHVYFFRYSIIRVQWLPAAYRCNHRTRGSHA